MRPVDRIAPLPWMTEGAGAVVWRCLTEGGGIARFVGGPVRNAIMGLPVTDFDMATDLRPESVIRLAETAEIRAVPTGIEHGTVTLVVDHVPVEVTTLRRDVETDGRHAVVAFTDDWAEDAARRDFTLNALYLDPDGSIFDPTGLGLADARAGRLRFVGLPEERILEDALRILRLFRFLASHGREEPDPAALEACGTLGPLIRNLSGERIWIELRKLLAAPRATRALRLMSETTATEHLWDGPIDVASTLRLMEIEATLGIPASPVRRLAALASDAAETATERLRLSGAERARLTDALAGLQTPLKADRDRRASIYRVGAEVFVDRLLLTLARDDAFSPRDAAPDLALAEHWTAPHFPISGADVVTLGIPPGPRVGELLRAIEDWWISQDFTANREACLSALKNRIEGD